MRLGTVSYRLDDLRKGVIIPIGMVGENDFTRVIFDAEDVYKYHPDAQVTMKVQPPKGGIYPATVTKDGNNVIWQVKAADLAHRGNGEIQLTFKADTMVEKSYIAKTDIKRSLIGNGPAPDPVQDWVDNAEEVLEDLEAAEVHQPIIGLDGYWYTWNQGTGEYEKTNTKAQGQDGHSPVLTSSKSGKTTTIFADGDQLAQILDGEDGQGADVIDDTAGEGDTDKTWSADKLAEETGNIKNAIQGLDNDKYEKPSGGIPATDMTQAVQDALTDAESAYQKPSGGIPASDIADGVIPTVPTVATQEQIKGGTDDLHPIAPIYQHESVFYALAKLAGADMASLSPVTVGQFPDTQKTAIQKMLGIYESPWELIREDTVTNATEADVEITVDGNGSAFELTDVYLQVWTPQQETAASIGDYGTVRCYYDSSNYITSQMNTWSQAANAAARYGQVLLENKNGAILNIVTQNATQYSSVGLTGRTNIPNNDALLKIGTFVLDKIVIKKVTGTIQYKLYGKRKWN